MKRVAYASGEIVVVFAHERLVAHAAIKTASDRSFGLTVGGILAAIACVRWWWVGSLSWLMSALLVIGVGLVTAGSLRPAMLTPLNRLWIKLGLVLFHAVNPLVTLLLFVVTIVPTGLIMRVLRYDPMRRRFDRNASTYRIERDPPGPPRESLRRPF